MEELECRICSVREAALGLGPSLGWAYRAAYRGEIPALRLGQRMVVPKVAPRDLPGNPSLVRRLSTSPH